MQFLGPKHSFPRCEVEGMGNLLLSSISKDFLLSLETPSSTYLIKKKKKRRWDARLDGSVG